MDKAACPEKQLASLMGLPEFPVQVYTRWEV